MTTRLVICADDPLLGAGVQALLDAQPDFDVIGQTAGGPDVLHAARDLSPDVTLVCSADVPPATLRELAENSRVILFAHMDRAEDVAVVLSCDVRGVLPLGSSPPHLMNAIRLVAGGDTVVVPLWFRQCAERLLVNEVPPVSAADLQSLTLREIEVLSLLSRGLGNAEIAQKLGISETTVRSHVHNMLGKLCVRSRAQAVALAYESGLISCSARTGPSADSHARK